MSTATFAKVTRKFVKAGIKPKTLLPIAPTTATIYKKSSLKDEVLGKAPGRYIERLNSWTGLGGGRIVNGITRDDFDEMRDWPTENVGVLGRYYPAIDSDTETDKARIFVERIMVEVFGKDAEYAVRKRGSGSRRLYAFAAADPSDLSTIVRTRHITFTMPEDDKTQHKIDVIGYGGQYLITGKHLSGDFYKWDDDGIANPEIVENLFELENNDVSRFIEVFQQRIEKLGGKIIANSGNKAIGEETAVDKLKPVMAIDTVLDGLDRLPNTEETFLHRDDFVSALAAIRAALGRDSYDAEDDIRAWATADPDWCDDEYFDKVWISLERVRVQQDALDRLFRQHGISVGAKEVFKDDVGPVKAKVEKQKASDKDERQTQLGSVAARYLFSYVSVSDGQGVVLMRQRWNATRDFQAIQWWKNEIPESCALAVELQESGYAATKQGLANMLRDLETHYPEAFYEGTTRHPNFDYGDIVEETRPDGSIRRLVNTRYVSAVIRAAGKPVKDARQAQADVEHILKFGTALFRDNADKKSTKQIDYHLDTLAYMAQTGRRPGHLLFLVGDSGVGKSLWLQMLAMTFDGIDPSSTQNGIVDGTKLANEGAARFALASTEGVRIIRVREMPEMRGGRQMAAVMASATSTLKQIVDPGPEGDSYMIERKRENSLPVKNHAMVCISSNYENSISVERQDRRIFYVHAGITINTKLPSEDYGRFGDIIASPERLAAFWRYLLGRQISHYDVMAAPPNTIGKQGRIIMEIEDDRARHIEAAVLQYEVSNRKFFSMPEFLETMSDCARAEYVNSQGKIGEDKDYTKLTFQETGLIAKTINSAKFADKLIKIERHDLRSAKKRPPKMFVFKNNSSTVEMLLDAGLYKLLELVEIEEEKGLVEHPIEMYRLDNDNSDED